MTMKAFYSILELVQRREDHISVNLILSDTILLCYFISKNYVKIEQNENHCSALVGDDVLPFHIEKYESVNMTTPACFCVL